MERLKQIAIRSYTVLRQPQLAPLYYLLISGLIGLVIFLIYKQQLLAAMETFGNEIRGLGLAYTV